MKSGSYIILAVLVLLPFSAFSKNEQLDYKILNQSVKKIGNEVSVNFDLKFSNSEVEKNNYVTLIPAIVSKIDGKKITIPGYIINGENRIKSFERSASFDKEILQMYSKVLDNKIISKEANYYFSFKTSYVEWMKDAKVVLVEYQCGCSGDIPVENEKIISDEIKGTAPIPMPEFEISYLVPTPETAKKRKVSGEAYIIFPVNKSILYKELADNTKELAKITKSIDEIKSTEGSVITSITIQAYSSPEGYIQDNINLSEKRAATLKNYVKNYYGFSENLFKVSSKGENWEGLIKQLPITTLTEKQQSDILEIIRIEDLVERKTKLKAYETGTPYKYLLQNFFPQLRRSEYTIDYNLPTFTIDKAKELLKTKPALLSLNEMFLLANSYEIGSPEFLDVFDIAVRLFPLDSFANINAASSELKQNNTTKAEKYLSNYMKSPEAYNNIGVMYAQKKNFENAIKYFQMAIDNGSIPAKNNIENLKNYINTTN